MGVYGESTGVIIRAIGRRLVEATGERRINRRFNAIVSQLKMHYLSEGAFESLIASQLLKKEKYIWS